jgi:hypothetical protein
MEPGSLGVGGINIKGWKFICTKEELLYDSKNIEIKREIILNEKATPTTLLKPFQIIFNRYSNINEISFYSFKPYILDKNDNSPSLQQITNALNNFNLTYEWRSGSRNL